MGTLGGKNIVDTTVNTEELNQHLVLYLFGFNKLVQQSNTSGDHILIRCSFLFWLKDN